MVASRSEMSSVIVTFLFISWISARPASICLNSSSYAPVIPVSLMFLAALIAFVVASENLKHDPFTIRCKEKY